MQARSRPGRPVTLVLDEPGLHRITLMDEHGRYHRIEVTVRGPANLRG
jgi:hypothetical protein